MIAPSRVVLGVHYPANVVGGIIAGGTFLIGAIRLTGYDPLRRFGPAAVVAVVALFAGDPLSSILMLGASIEGALAWWLLCPSLETRLPEARFAVVSVGIVVFTSVLLILGGYTQLAVRGLTTTLVFGGIVALPTIAHRVVRLRGRWLSPPSS